METKDCKKEEFIIKTDAKNKFMCRDAYECLKNLKLLHINKLNAREFKVTVSTPHSKDLFIEALAIFLCNSYLYGIGCQAFANKFSIDIIRRLHAEAFFVELPKEAAYFQSLAIMNLKLYFKTNNTIDLVKYMQFNMNKLNKEYANLLTQPSILKKLEKGCYKIMSEDEDVLLEIAILAHDFFKEIPIVNELNIYIDNDILLMEDENHTLFGSVSLPEEFLNIVDIDKLPPISYVFVMLTAIMPKKAIIWGNIEPGLNNKLKKLMPEAIKSIMEIDNRVETLELTFKDEQFPFVGSFVFDDDDEDF